VFVFRNRRQTSVKILVFDGQGFWLCLKRLSSGKFRFWPAGGSESAQTLEAHQLQLLLSAGDPGAAETAPPAWRRVRAEG
jgi:transposase